MSHNIANTSTSTSAPTASLPTVEEINGWDRDRVKRFLQAKSTELELEENDIDIIYSKKVSGKAFLRLTEEQLTRVPGTFQLDYTPASAIAELVKQIKGVSAESSKRQYLVDYEEEQNRNVKRIRKYPSPSSFAHINYLYDHEFIIYRPSSCVGTPLILYNSAFSQFKEDFNNEKLPMSKEHNQWTLNCIKTMSDFYSDEKLRQKEFHEIIRELFSKDVKVIQLDDNSSNDGILELDFHTYSVLFLLIEIKNEIGT
ncbi:10100_t:CDS:2, partial [Funneliformis geosporum]